MLAAKVVLVIVFTLQAGGGFSPGISTWKRNMKTEAACAKKLAELKKARPSLDAWCEALPPKGKQA